MGFDLLFFHFTPTASTSFSIVSLTNNVEYLKFFFTKIEITPQLESCLQYEFARLKFGILQI